MNLFLLAIGLLGGAGVLARATQSRPRLCTAIAVLGGVAGCACGLASAIAALGAGQAPSLNAEWSVPGGELHLEIDPLSAFFLLPLFGLSLLATIYGAGYLAPWRDKRPLGASWLFLHVLVACMALVVVARNGVLFLVAWEGMSLASYFLVTFEDEKEEVRSAGWTYLVATHFGTAFLLAMFLLLGRETGSMDFADFRTGGQAGLLFLLALIGFGTKAGFMPLHVWLPEAHPAAPSHVSALMSGVMIKMGIYGLVRTLTWLGLPPAWWGWVLIGIGAISGVLGVMIAIAQRDLKRMLAYSSVENIGVVSLGLGVGVVGLSHASPAMAAVGFAGALLHVANHAAFKGLLFLGAGSVVHATKTREIDRLGGLLKRMPTTGLLFLIGAAAISGLPPLNGFVGEFLIYTGAFRGVTEFGTRGAFASLVVIASLALIGGLAAACFLRAFGILFLGAPRSEHAEHAHEAKRSMLWPMGILAATCLAIGLCAPFVADALAPAVAVSSGIHLGEVRSGLAGAADPLARVAWVSCGLIALVGVLALLRSRLLSGRTVTESGTWGCGYLYPTARMQYTASSFAQPITSFFQGALGTRTTLRPPQGDFPKEASFASETPDACRERGYRPVFVAVEERLSRLRWLQHGSIHLYVLYIALTLVLLLVWKLR